MNGLQSKLYLAEKKIAELQDELAEFKIKLKSANETMEVMQDIIDSEKYHETI